MNKSREFGITFFTIFILIFLFIFFKNEEINVYIFIVSIIFLILGILKAKILLPLRYVWIKFGIYIGKFISPIVIFVVYFSVILLTKIALIIFKKDVLKLKINKNLNSYWEERKKTNIDMNNQY
tara:strand:- start:665 stop:1036 length:372 start_codon:yes stop_codon:yes gene_type:complete